MMKSCLLLQYLEFVIDNDFNMFQTSVHNFPLHNKDVYECHFEKEYDDENNKEPVV